MARYDASLMVRCLGADSIGTSQDVNLASGTSRDTFDTLGYRSILVVLDARPNSNSSLSTSAYMGIEFRHSDNATSGFAQVPKEQIEVSDNEHNVTHDHAVFMRIQNQSAEHRVVEASYMGTKRYLQVWAVEVGTVSGNLRFGWAVLGVNPSVV